MEMLHVNEESFSLSLINELEPFFKRNGFLKSHASLLYILNNLSDLRTKQLIVRNDKNSIVGCNLFIKTRAYILDHDEEIYWSNSTYLDPSYRASCGMKLMMKTEERTNVFGFGLTEINEKLQHLLGNFFLGKSEAYLIHIPHSDLKCSARRTNFCIPKYFEVDGLKWKRIMHSSELHYPNGGYWNKNNLAIDFVRDEDFIQKRFLNHYREYYIYAPVQSEYSAYFVWRFIHQNDSTALYLVDYRFPIDTPKQMESILNALTYLASLNNIQRVFVFTTIGLPQIGYKTTIYGSPSLIVTNCTVFSNPQIFVTPADSDCELWLE